jgi:hypothetical protein
MAAGQLGLKEGAQQPQKYAKTTPLDDGVSLYYYIFIEFGPHFF